MRKFVQSFLVGKVLESESAPVTTLRTSSTAALKSPRKFVTNLATSFGDDRPIIMRLVRRAFSDWIVEIVLEICNYNKFGLWERADTN